MKKVALLVGVSEYQPGLQPLPSAIEDVRAMQRVLQHPEMGGFDKVDVLTNPITQALRIEIYNLFAERSPEDLVLFYFSGHGVKDKQHYNLFLATPETIKDSKGSVVPPTAVAASYIQTQINDSPSEHEVIILDCCYSGAIAKGMTAKDEGEIDIIAELGGKGRAILTSSTSVQSSFQQEGTLSIYTQYLVEGIETGAADSDNDGRISVDELHQYASKKVQQASPAMTPQFYPVEEGYKIYLARSPIDDPKLKYRKAVQEIVQENQGNIDLILDRPYLDELRHSLEISAEEAKNIETEVLEPFRQRQRKLQLYEEVFSQALQKDSVIINKARRKLKRLQKVLGLRDEDVKPIESQFTSQPQPEAKTPKATESATSPILPRAEGKETSKIATQKEEQHQQNLEQYRQSFSQAVEQEFPLKEPSLRKLRNLQQSLQLTDEEVSQIEQPIVDQKEVEARKREKESRKRQQQEAKKLQQQREKAERLPQQQEIQTRRQEEAITIPTPITRKQFFKWVGLGGGGLVTTIVLSQFLKNESDSIEKQPVTEIKPNSPTVTKPKPIPPTEDETKSSTLPLQTVDFKTVTVNDKGQEVKRESEQAQYFTQDLGNSITLDMVSIPSGSFMMGTEEEEIERLVKKFDWEYFRREKPQHKVTVKPFFLGKYQVTQAQWKVIASLPKVNHDLNPDPSVFKGDDLPVERVSWEDAIEFCQRLSLQTGKEYRLPSEAEWEYACRARTDTPFHFGETITGDLANYAASRTYANEAKGEDRGKTTPVGSFPPNAFGLYDMHGNVWEWCQDDWHDNYEGAPDDGSAWISGNSIIKVIRGGSWNGIPLLCRSAYRYYGARAVRGSIFGFRVVCVAGSTT